MFFKNWPKKMNITARGDVLNKKKVKKNDTQWSAGTAGNHQTPAEAENPRNCENKRFFTVRVESDVDVLFMKVGGTRVNCKKKEKTENLRP